MSCQKRQINGVLLDKYDEILIITYWFYTCSSIEGLRKLDMCIVYELCTFVGGEIFFGGGKTLVVWEALWESPIIEKPIRDIWRPLPTWALHTTNTFFSIHTTTSLKSIKKKRNTKKDNCNFWIYKNAYIFVVVFFTIKITSLLNHYRIYR